MTLREAIEHLQDSIDHKTDWCESCKQEHMQLLEWLIELEQRRQMELGGIHQVLCD